MNITELTTEDNRYPQGVLGNLPTDYAAQLYVDGDPGIFNLPSIGIVGARAATGYGEHITQEWATIFAHVGLVVVSGAAYGIDGVAHRAALAAGGKTIAYLAGGVDRRYPAGHDELIRRIAKEGAVASEQPLGAGPTKERFLARNRLIAAHVDALLVVEAGPRSGSLNAAGWAKRAGVPIFAVPGPVTSSASAGTHALIRNGDATLADSPQVVLDQIGGQA